MSSFDDRKNVFEKKFALDEAMMFKAEARCCKLLGQWIAEKMALTDEETTDFAAGVVSANLEEPGFNDVKRHLMPLIKEKSLSISEEELDSKLDELFSLAQEQIKSEVE